MTDIQCVPIVAMFRPRRSDVKMKLACTALPVLIEEADKNNSLFLHPCCYDQEQIATTITKTVVE